MRRREELLLPTRWPTTLAPRTTPTSTRTARTPTLTHLKMRETSIIRRTPILFRRCQPRMTLSMMKQWPPMTLRSPQ